MEDREFFDLLYQHFAKTTEAKDSYWMYEEERDPSLDVRNFNIFAVASEEDRTWIGVVYSEEDAEFITALHGCFPDLVRRMHDALDESDRLDEDRDNQEVSIATLIEENSALRYAQQDLEDEAHFLRRKVAELRDNAVGRDAALAEQIKYSQHLEDELSEIQWRMDGLEK